MIGDCMQEMLWGGWPLHSKFKAANLGTAVHTAAGVRFVPNLWAPM